MSSTLSSGTLRLSGGDEAAGDDSAPRLFLTVCRGRTRFPRRPLDGRTFRIGSGGQCQLRLGGTIPVHHSTISFAEGELLITAVAGQPTLRVNGLECSRAPVRSGDLIEIGPFVLAVEAPAVAERSAAELVALLEAEQTMVDEYETGRLRGGEALLNAVRRRAAELSREPAQEPAAAFLDDLETAVELLQDFSQEMERRAGRLSEREAGFARAAQRLIDAQQRLASQIDAVQRRLDGADGEPAIPLRKVA